MRRRAGHRADRRRTTASRCRPRRSRRRSRRARRRSSSARRRTRPAPRTTRRELRALARGLRRRATAGSSSTRSTPTSSTTASSTSRPPRRSRERRSRSRIVIVDGVSKTYAMTGWRIGWSIAPERLVEGARHGPGPEHHERDRHRAARGASPRSPARKRTCERCAPPFEKRRNVMVEGLRSIPGVRCRMPEGAFYAFADCRGALRPRVQGQADRRTTRTSRSSSSTKRTSRRCPAARSARRATCASATRRAKSASRRHRVDQARHRGLAAQDADLTTWRASISAPIMRASS